MTDLIQKGKQIMDYFSTSYEIKYGSKPLINRNTAKWASRDVVESFGMEDCKKAIDWYFQVKDSGHEWSWYVNNVEKLIAARKLKEEDDKARKITREKARAWLSE